MELNLLELVHLCNQRLGEGAAGIRARKTHKERRENLKVGQRQKKKIV